MGFEIRARYNKNIIYFVDGKKELKVTSYRFDKDGNLLYRSYRGTEMVQQLKGAFENGSFTASPNQTRNKKEAVTLERYVFLAFRGKSCIIDLFHDEIISAQG